MKSKKIIALILILSFALGFSACKSRTAEKEEKPKGARENIGVVETIKPESRDESQPEPESKLADGDLASARDKTDGFLRTAKTGERDQIQKYADYNKLFALEDGQNADWILQQVLMRMKYEILAVETAAGDDGSTSADGKVTASVKISNVDMNVILPLYYQQAMELEFNNALSDKPKDASELDREYRAIFAGLASKNAESRVEKSIDIELTKGDDDWKIKIDSKLGDAMLGGYIEAREKITQSGFSQPDSPDADSGGESEAGDPDYETDEFGMVPPRE